MEMLTSNYEVMFVISKKNDSTQAKAIVEKLLDAVKPEDLVIKTLAVESFAYPIKHEKSGYFFVATFRATNKNIGELNRLLKISGDVLRYLVINTDKNYGARPLKNEKKMKQAEVRAKKYEEIRKQAEINEAKGIFTPPASTPERSQQNQKRPKILKSQKRYLRNSYRKVGIYSRNENGEIIYEPVVHTPKNNLKVKSGQPGEEVSAQPADNASSVVVRPAINETLKREVEVKKPAPVQEFPVVIEREIFVPVEEVPSTAKPKVEHKPTAKPEPKVEPKIEKATPVVKPESKVEHKPVAKTEPVKVEPKVEHKPTAKPEPKVEPKIEKVTPVVKPEPVKAKVTKVEPKVEAKPTKTKTTKAVTKTTTKSASKSKAFNVEPVAVETVEPKKTVRKPATKTIKTKTDEKTTSAPKTRRTTKKVNPTDLLSDSDGVSVSMVVKPKKTKTTSTSSSTTKKTSTKRSSKTTK